MAKRYTERQASNFLKDAQDDYFERIAETFAVDGRIDGVTARTIFTFLGPVTFHEWLEYAKLENTVEWDG